MQWLRNDFDFWGLDYVKKCIKHFKGRCTDLNVSNSLIEIMIIFISLYMPICNIVNIKHNITCLYVLLEILSDTCYSCNLLHLTVVSTIGLLSPAVVRNIQTANANLRNKCDNSRFF